MAKGLGNSHCDHEGRGGHEGQESHADSCGDKEVEEPVKAKPSCMDAPAEAGMGPPFGVLPNC